MLRVVVMCLFALFLAVPEVLAQGSAGSHGYGLFRDGDGYVLPRRDIRVNRRACRAAARQAAWSHSAADYGSAGSDSYGSAGSTSYGSAGSTGNMAPAPPSDVTRTQELIEMQDRLVKLQAEIQVETERIARELASSVTEVEPERARFTRVAATLLKEPDPLAEHAEYLAIR